MLLFAMFDEDDGVDVEVVDDVDDEITELLAMLRTIGGMLTTKVSRSDNSMEPCR